MRKNGSLRIRGEGERNHELQAYVPDAFHLRGGILCLRAEKRSAVYARKRRAYTSGMMTTFHKFSQQYGRFEVRCRVPSGSGFWPAVWLLPVSEAWPPEIDVLEILGNAPTVAHFTNHWGKDASGQHRQHGETMTGVDFSRDFHVFAIEWKPASITWFVDGRERARSTEGIPHQPMFLLLNLAIGGNFDTGLPGTPGRATPFPSCFEVDYVRVYRAH